MHLVRSLALSVCLGLCFIPGAMQPAGAQVDFTISIDVEPPPLPVYEQPPIPAADYLWVPGYWTWSEDVGYYWVPGTWVLPPEPGLLWTPGYWGWRDGVYLFFSGYWALQIGYYGGVYYGYGYTGEGYEGGYWREGRFFYNTTVNNFGSVRIVNVYSKTVVVTRASTVSFNGGAGGTTARPTPEQLALARERHVPPTRAQTQHVEAAAKDPSLSLAHNQGHPAVAATAHAGEFKGAGVVAARPGPPVAVRPAKIVPAPEAKPAAKKEETKEKKPPTAEGKPPTTTEQPKEKKPPTPEGKPATTKEETKEKKPPTTEGKPATTKEETKEKKPPTTEGKPAPKPEAARPAPAPHAPPPGKPKCPPGEHCE